MLPSSFEPGRPFGLRDRDGMLVLDRSAADLLNRMLAATRGGGRMSVAAPLLMSEGASGRALGVSGPTVIHAQLSGGGNPYSFQQAYYEPGTGFVPFAAGHSGTNAYEANGKAGLDGKFVELTYEPMSDDWRFQWIGYGCNVTPTICVAPISTCTGNPPIIGATVTLKQGGSDIATCTTTRQIKTLTLNAVGSGYTDGTDFALGITGGGGSGASALFDVVGGSVTNLRLIDGGHDFDGTTVTLDFSASAGGSGASATYVLAVQCCFRGIALGSYTVTVDADGFPTYTSPTVKVPPCSVSLGPIMTPNKVQVLIWVGGCGRVELNTSYAQLGGVTVNAVQGGVTVDSRVTDSTGHVMMYVPPAATTYTAVGTGRYASNSATATFTDTCRNHINNPLADRQINLPAASGYRCAPRCRDPIPLTLNLSTPADGGFVLTYDSTYGVWWATDGTIFYAYNGDLWRGNGTTPLAAAACVISPGNNIFNGYTYSESCSPFMASWVGIPNATVRGLSGGGGFCVFQGFTPPANGTITISE